jgi:drug/metabolite transporter (DMT)-like permease
MILSMAGFAIEDLFLKFSSRAMPLGQIGMIMGLTGIVVFGLLAARQGQSPLPAALLSRTIAIRSACELAGRLFYALAIALTPVSTASAILQATPILVVLGAAVIFGEKVGRLRWALILLGFLGVLIIIRPGLHDFEPLTLLAVLGMAGFAGRDLATRAAPLSLTDNQLGVVGFAMLTLSGAILTLWTGDLRWPDARGLGLLTATALFGILGYAALTRAMRTGQVAAVTPFRYSRLVFAMFLGILVLGERPDAATFFGAGLIVACGLALMLRRARVRP